MGLSCFVSDVVSDVVFDVVTREDEEPSVKKMKMDDDLGGGLADLTKAEVTEVGSRSRL